MAKREKLAKKDSGNVYSMGGKSLICGFVGGSDVFPAEEIEEIEAEKGRGVRRLEKSPEIASSHFDPAYIFDDKLIKEVGGSLPLDYLEDFEPKVAIDNVTVQGVPLVVYLDMYNIDSDPPSLADGVPVTQYVLGMSYDRIYPMITDGGKSGHEGRAITPQSSHEIEGVRKAVFAKSHNCSIYYRDGRRHGKTPEQKPRYKNISRRTHRTGCCLGPEE